MLDQHSDSKKWNFDYHFFHKILSWKLQNSALTTHLFLFETSTDIKSEGKKLG